MLKQSASGSESPRRHSQRVLIHCIWSGQIRPGAIISHLVGIDEAPRIYEVMRDSPSPLFGVVFDWA